ncbi:hypothetical protein AN639_12090 [Candidatus Epulonipiscium fishelsonii]|uniref:Uncharacterized protein n=1 Tax=Candidatus Epulonipiscium fishelsonii TaxID=77094 RepID=A0ACC8X7K5_9FIRM|nr:hypothetical protein AN396_12530 [Epulopiscium sp. SCG-B11WGA-EpuloA1]ONI42667.1 hypothetical protein AN639_12090 [Epulopiscium sp. SCG-B05WGA-EpuloA1]
MKKKLDLSGYIFILPSIVILTISVFYPIIWSFIASFKEIKMVDLRKARLWEVPGEFVSFDNYLTALNDPLFIKAIGNTFRFAIVYIPIILVFSIGIALLINDKFRGVGAVRTIVFMPYIISIVSAGVIFMSLFRSDNGIVNATLNTLGIEGVAWLGDGKYAMAVIAIMSAWRKIGYFMLMFLSGLQTIPSELYEAGDVDGTTYIQKFRYIIFPLLLKITSIVVILALVDVLKVFQEVYIMTGGGPDNSTITLPFLIYNEAFSYLRLGNGAAISYILFTVTVIVVIVQNKVLKKKMDY